MPDSKKMLKRTHVIYTGTVQGVGFRFTVAGLARRLGVAGWVSNLDNGDVALEAEAPADILDHFLDDIKSHFSTHIAGEQVTWVEPTGADAGFAIHF